MLSNTAKAHHEAGHLIAAASLGWTLTGASIDAAGGSADYRMPATATAADRFVVALAGPVGETYSTGHFSCSGSDLATCLSLLAGIEGFARTAGWLEAPAAAAAYARAERILAANADALRKVAAALEARRTLNASDLAALLGLKAPAESFTARTAPVPASAADVEARLAGISADGRDAWDVAAAALDSRTRAKLERHYGKTLPGQRTGARLADGSSRFAGIGPREAATPAARARALQLAVDFVNR